MSKTEAGEPITPELLRRCPLPQPDGDGDKDERGRVLVIGGSVAVPGGALLAATAALRAGAGKLQIATCRSIAVHLGLAMPEALVFGLEETPDGGIHPSAAGRLKAPIQRCDAVLIGPGMMDEAAVAALTADLLRTVDGPAFVLDAAALAGLRASAKLLHGHDGRLVLTPHAGEMAALFDLEKSEVLADPLAVARCAAAELRCVVALKGGCTYIVAPSGNTWFYDGGSVGLATSGSGDTLAGIVTGLLARGASPVEAAQWAVYLHGEAGNRLCRSVGPLGFLARELLAEVPRILAGFPQQRSGRDG
jgi:hydroxyethylthiazole kinase-like uncharacterized protein yjeF